MTESFFESAGAIITRYGGGEWLVACVQHASGAVLIALLPLLLSVAGALRCKQPSLALLVTMVGEDVSWVLLCSVILADGNRWGYTSAFLQSIWAIVALLAASVSLMLIRHKLLHSSNASAKNGGWT